MTKVVRRDGAAAVLVALDEGEVRSLLDGGGFTINLDKEAGCRPGALVITMDAGVAELIEAAVSHGGQVFPLGQQ